jgi:L-rhamnose-H+ transport protein
LRGVWLPPIFKLFLPTIPVDENLVQIASTLPGQITLAGIGVTLLGIFIAAMAGLTKEREMPAEQKKSAIAEFSFSKGILVATFSGIMSACFAFGLTAAKPIADATAAMGTSTLWTGLPKLVVVLLGGFTTNFIWCALLNVKNKTGHEYLSSTYRPNANAATELILENPIDAPSEEIVRQSGGAIGNAGEPVPMLTNYLFSALAGTTWYFQFFFYTMGETQMGKFGFASWTLHMASIIIFSTLWGVYFNEWKGASRKAQGLITAGIGTLVLSTIIIGIGTYLKGKG